MKHFDMSVIWASSLDVARLQSDHDSMIDTILSAFYVRFFGCRKHPIRGEA
jgi:hypothetical protein